MRALDVLGPAGDDPALLEAVHPGGPDVWAQVRYARDHEWAATAEDVVRVRTTLALRGLDDAGVRERIERALAAPRA
jgi:glycerol-3-phosphate dehydrogenase